MARKRKSIINAANKKRRLLDQLGDVCQGCYRNFPIEDLTLDHILPCNDGGEGNIENLTLLCSKCNRIKGSDLTLTGLRRFNKLRQMGYRVERPSRLVRLLDWLRERLAK